MDAGVAQQRYGPTERHLAGIRLHHRGPHPFESSEKPFWGVLDTRMDAGEVGGRGEAR
jgi:hypothetical protein